MKDKIPFFDEILADWKEYKNTQIVPFKDQLAEGIAFLHFAIGWLYRRKNEKGK